MAPAQPVSGSQSPQGVQTPSSSQFLLCSSAAAGGSGSWPPRSCCETPSAPGVRLGHWVRWLPLLILLLGYLLAHLLYSDVNIWFLNFLPSPIVYPQSVLNSLLDNIGYLLLVAASPLAEPLAGIPSPP